MSKTVVILGGSYAGLTVAHKLLKTTLPSVKNLEVILVNPSDHFFYNLPTVRAIIPSAFDDQKLYYSIPDGFKYAGKSFQFIEGKAKHVDSAAKYVTISIMGGQKIQYYDILVVASGSNTIGQAPWKANGLSFSDIKTELLEVQEKVAAAKSIVVGGGGATGVETVAELGFEYGKTKEITLITAGGVVLPGTPLVPAQQKSSEAELERLSVKIVHNTRVLDSRLVANNRTAITLSNGQTIVVDLYLPTVGLSNNTSFMPAAYLDSKGHVNVDEFLRVKTATDIWAAGDVTPLERSGVLIAKAQGAHLAKNIDLVLKGQKPVPYKVPAKDTMMVTLGKRKGVANAMGFKLPSSLVWLAKCRGFFISTAKGYADGSGV
ncbi:hypothetical protein B0O99DRAFT_744665 [Bisporella sp. PMI_857]|nr:hypothetical protein B0O99DRAFT_744665 [Bisporella sp. PMI_857]